MITPEKIAEWIKEVEQRPTSAPLIIQFIANRLRELSSRNEELLSENIALLTGKRIEEYQQRINHLEYQLDLLKRQVSSDLGEAVSRENCGTQPEPKAAPTGQTTSLLVYNVLGQVLRLNIPPEPAARGNWFNLTDPLSPTLEAPRLSGVAAMEELLFVFSSGRISTSPLQNLLNASDSPTLDWQHATIPHEPRAIETLACIVPISHLPLAEFFLQITRRGCVKKINASLVPSILTNHFIGAGIKQPADRTFEITLGKNDDRLVLISAQGHLQVLECRNLTTSIEEVIRLDNTDHLVAAFILPPEDSLLIVTQIGKLIHRIGNSLESSPSNKSKGLAILSPRRIEEGVRVIAGLAMKERGGAAALHRDGCLSLHSIQDLIDQGIVATQNELVAFTAF